MAEQTFKSPGFFEREIEIISRPLNRNLATPVGIIGPASKGPAFVPTTVSSSEEFIRIFGQPDTDRSAAHAVTEFFANNGQAATFCRILGTGSSTLSGPNFAGFKVEGTGISGDDNVRATGAVQFLVADHRVNPAEHVTLGILNDNDSITTTGDADPSSGVVDNNEDTVQLVRAMIFMHKDYTLRIRDLSETAAEQDDNDVANIDEAGLFSIVIADASGTVYGVPYTVSLDPESSQYIHKVLNTDPFTFEDQKHFLYADFPVDNEIASTKSLDLNNNSDLLDTAEQMTVAVVRGDATHMNKYGDFSSRYSSPRTTQFISQPFGTVEYPLFHVESLDDGAYASSKYKISISNLKASTEKNYKYGTFSLQLRDLKDTDDKPVIYESYSRCSLDPNAKNFIARIIGDQKIQLSLDVDDQDEKRLVRTGTFPNKSKRVRVVMSSDVLRGEVPDSALPFGFKGIPALRTTTTGNDASGSGDDTTSLIAGKDGGTDKITAAANSTNRLSHSVLPPLPFRSKLTRGLFTKNSAYFQKYFGQSLDETTNDKCTEETVKTSFHWGLLNTRVENIADPNRGSTQSKYSRLTENLCKFLSNDSATRFSDAAADKFNNNKFSLSKVAFPVFHVKDIVGTPQSAFLEAVYVRNADVDSGLYEPDTHRINMNGDSSIQPFDFEDHDSNTTADIDLDDVIVGQQYIISVTHSGLSSVGATDLSVGAIFVATAKGAAGVGKVKLYRTKRATLAKLLAEDVTKFNKYSLMTKFTAPFYGGFDGVNILNRDDFYFTDRSTSQDVGGHAVVGGYSSGLDATDGDSPMQGELLNNNAVESYRNAIRLMTDEMIVDTNVLVIPGIRESLVTDFAARRVKHYGKAIYLMDIPHYTAENERIYVASNGLSSGSADVSMTSSVFDTRELDSSYVATYFPDVMILDSGDDSEALKTNQRIVRVPSSVVALGAIARSDSATRSPWFAPAGFSRGSLSSVRATDVRLNAADRDELYEARINPIANFPNNQFVIFGQKTTQIARTALDRVNVRRLMVHIKRRIQKVAQRLLFQQNDAKTRASFIEASSEILQAVQIGQGIEDFRVIMDDSNNTQEDVDNNRLNGKIIVIPTRAVEFIAMDFVITNAGVVFP